MLGGFGNITTTLGAAVALSLASFGLAVLALLGVLNLVSATRMGLGTMNSHC